MGFQAHTEDNRDLLLDRMQRVESLLEQLIEVGHKVERDVSLAGLGLPAQRKSGYFTPASDYQSHDSFNPPSEPCVATTNITDGMPESCRKLTEDLLKAFPPQEDIDAFCKSDYITTFYCHQIFTHAGDRPEHEAFEFVNNIAKIPEPTTSPVLVAKRMIILALFLQYFRSQNSNVLPEHPTVVMERLVDTAVRLVIANEKIVCCIEGLECIILEGVFQFNDGNLRRAWLTFRKAMVIAQLMKIDLPNPPPLVAIENSAKTNPKFLWFRIVYMDSFISLMLGLPHGGQDTNMDHDDPGETPSRKLERAHTLVGRGIVDRNRRDPSFPDLDTTRELDRKLLNAAKALPDKFWLPPNFTNLQPNTRELFWEVMRFCDQLQHYNLVHLLHLPYLLRNDKESSYHAYAKITCVNASRELLSRFLAYQKFTCKSAVRCCRVPEFLALMAAMTIILAHIDSHKLEVDDWRAHQRVGDRGMVEKLLENLEDEGKRANDSTTIKSAEQLRKLLDIENDSAHGISHSARNTLCCLEQSCGELQLSIPYFGMIKIGREGITKDGLIEANPIESLPTDISDSVYVANHLFSTAGFGEALHQDFRPSYLLPENDTQPMRASQTVPAGLSTDAELHQQQLQYPALSASVNDWPYQGVDAAFFDSVMRGAVDWDPTLQGNIS
jgi:hypothetical protein